MFLELVFVASMASAVGGSDCLRFATPVNVSRIRRHPQVSAIQRINSKFNATALLKDGSALRIEHIACHDSGVSLALWKAERQKFSDVEMWLAHAIRAVNIAFEPHIAAEFIEAVKSGSYKIHEQKSRLEILVTGRHGTGFIVVADTLLSGELLTIDYLIEG